jgi:hypothetical protein
MMANKERQDNLQVLTDAVQLVGPQKLLSEKEVPKKILENPFLSGKSAKKKGFLKVGPTTFQLTDVVSKNNRMYPSLVMSEATKEILPTVKSMQCIGELDHMTVKDSPFPKLAFCSHVVTELWFDQASKAIIGSLVVLPTTYGKLFRDLLEAGISTGVSVRGLGETEKITEGMKQFDKVMRFRTITYEPVAWPGFGGLLLNKNITKTVETLSEGFQLAPIETQAVVVDDFLSKLQKDFSRISPMEKYLAISKLIINLHGK